MSVTMPFTKASFTEAKQDKYKAAVASAAGTSADNVEILDIKEVRRRAGSIQVETKIRAADAAGATKLADTLGTGDALLNKINTELEKQGLPKSTGVTAPTTVFSSSNRRTAGVWSTLLAAGSAAWMAGLFV